MAKNENDIKILEQQLSESPHTFLKHLVEKYPEQVVFSTSFSMEDQVITQMLAGHDLAVKIFTLDTGRVFTETYDTWGFTLEKYKLNIESFYPNADALQQFVTEKGPDSFYRSVENRKTCCHIRKVEPLQRALKGNKIWITGIRSEQSNNREDMKMLEWDEANQIIKYHPLLHWTLDEVKKYIVENKIPYNKLHDKGFLSIGCAPCTRAVKDGEDFRAGRWWWEDNSKKECGLHIHEHSGSNSL